MHKPQFAARFVLAALCLAAVFFLPLAAQAVVPADIAGIWAPEDGGTTVEIRQEADMTCTVYLASVPDSADEAAKAFVGSVFVTGLVWNAKKSMLENGVLKTDENSGIGIIHCDLKKGRDGQLEFRIRKGLFSHTSRWRRP